MRISIPDQVCMLDLLRVDLRVRGVDDKKQLTSRDEILAGNHHKAACMRARRGLASPAVSRYA